MCSIWSTSSISLTFVLLLNDLLLQCYQIRDGEEPVFKPYNTFPLSATQFRN